MASQTELKIAEWQSFVGITPAKGRRAEILEKITRHAVSLIQLAALEKSGIRNGDGCWHGGSPFALIAENLKELVESLTPGK